LHPNLTPFKISTSKATIYKLAEDFDRKKLATEMYGILARIHTVLEYEFAQSPQLEKVRVH
jgi:hypothetical protein